MDKQLSGFDPKVQETYKRVMGTPVPSATTQTSTPNPSPSIQPVQNTTQPTPAATVQPTALTATMQNVTTPAPEVVKKEEVVTVQVPETPIVSVTNSQVFSSSKKAKKVSPIIVVLGIVVFFIVYTLVWVKILGAQIPFLP